MPGVGGRRADPSSGRDGPGAERRCRVAVLVLRYFDDLTEAETARVLGCSVGTVKSQSYRSRMGPVSTLRAHGQPAALAAAADTIYVSFTISGSGATSDIRAYPVPPACR